MDDHCAPGVPTKVDSAPGMDRRSALRKAAVAGAVAWSAPMISSTVQAAGGNDICTPKCAGTPFVCFRYLESSSPGPCDTWEMFSMDLFSVANCGCGGSTAGGCLILPGSWSFDNGSTAAIETDGGFTVTGLPTNIVLTSTNTLEARMFCVDRKGDRVWTYSTYNLVLTKNDCTRSFGVIKTSVVNGGLGGFNCAPENGGCDSPTRVVDVCNNEQPDPTSRSAATRRSATSRL